MHANSRWTGLENRDGETGEKEPRPSPQSRSAITGGKHGDKLYGLTTRVYTDTA